MTQLAAQFVPPVLLGRTSDGQMVYASEAMINFFLTMLNRTGGAAGVSSDTLDLLSTLVTARSVGGASGASVADVGAVALVAGLLGLVKRSSAVTTTQAVTAPLVASQSLTAGNIVSIWDNSGVANVRLADVADDTKIADGFVLANVSSLATATVYFPGQIITGLSSLTPGTIYYLAASGGITTTTPVSGWLQIVGKSLSATSLIFYPQPGVLL